MSVSFDLGIPAVPLDFSGLREGGNDFMQYMNSGQGRTTDPSSVPDFKNFPNTTAGETSITGGITLVDYNGSEYMLGRVLKSDFVIVLKEYVVKKIDELGSKCPLTFSPWTWEIFIKHQYNKFIEWVSKTENDEGGHVNRNQYEQFLRDYNEKKCNMFGEVFKNGQWISNFHLWNGLWLFSKKHLIHESHYKYGVNNGDSESNPGRNDELDKESGQIQNLSKKKKGFKTSLDSVLLKGSVETRIMIEGSYWTNGKLTLYLEDEFDARGQPYDPISFPTSAVRPVTRCSNRYFYITNEYGRVKFVSKFGFTVGSINVMDLEFVKAQKKPTAKEVAEENFKKYKAIEKISLTLCTIN